jgi:DNA invertase Pin-like site-specific DNA recombinase
MSSRAIRRDSDGLAATSGRGRAGGRPPALLPYQVKYARSQVDAGVAISEIAAELGVHRATVYRALQPISSADLRVKPGRHKERSLDETSSWRPFQVSGGTKERVGPDAAPLDPRSQT